MTPDYLSLLFTRSKDPMGIVRLDGYLDEVNPAFTTVLGYSRDELLSRPLVDFIHPDDQTPTLTEYGRLGEGEESLGFTNRYLTKSGTVVWLEWNSEVLPDGRVYGIGRNVTKRKKKMEDLERQNSELRLRSLTIKQMAMLDDLTRVMSRHGLREWLTKRSPPLGALLIDIDDFKYVNERYTHTGGDLVLQVIAQTLHACVRLEDVVARVGGDEFLVVVPRVESVEGTRRIADRFMEAIRRTPCYAKSGEPINFTVTISAAYVPENDLHPHVTIKALLAATSQALLNGKKQEKNSIYVSQFEGPLDTHDQAHYDED